MLGDGIFNVVHRGQWQHFWKERVLQKTWSDWINAFIQKRRMMAETAANSVRLLIKVSRDTWRPSLRCGEPWCMQRFTKCFSKPCSSKREKKPPVLFFMFFFTGLLTDKLLQNCLPASCFFFFFLFFNQALLENVKLFFVCFKSLFVYFEGICKILDLKSQQSSCLTRLSCCSLGVKRSWLRGLWSAVAGLLRVSCWEETPG